jgi:hypothetical protein
MVIPTFRLNGFDYEACYGGVPFFDCFFDKFEDTFFFTEIGTDVLFKRVLELGEGDLWPIE